MRPTLMSKQLFFQGRSLISGGPEAAAAQAPGLLEQGYFSSRGVKSSM